VSGCGGSGGGDPPLSSARAFRNLLKELEPMRREPMILQRFQVHAVTMTGK